MWPSYHAKHPAERQEQQQPGRRKAQHRFGRVPPLRPRQCEKCCQRPQTFFYNKQHELSYSLQKYADSRLLPSKNCRDKNQGMIGALAHVMSGFTAGIGVCSDRGEPHFSTFHCWQAASTYMPRALSFSSLKFTLEGSRRPDHE
jgi:hypothetical protein